jgi:UDP-N-acetylmuramate--alanine ligase
VTTAAAANATPLASPSPNRTSLGTSVASPEQIADSIRSRMLGDRATGPSPPSIHFIGIGGSGMSGLAAMLAAAGCRCTGEDRSASIVLERLAGSGIAIEVGEIVSMPEQVDLVVASAAIAQDHPTLIAARARGVETVGYADALGRLQAGRTAVCIAGTHGKSTTTSLLGHILLETGLDPGVIVGARCPSFEANRPGRGTAVTGLATGSARVGSDRVPSGPLAGRPGILVAEACEYRSSFLRHRPTMALVNNVEEDHLDAFRDLDEIVEAFRAFAASLPPAAEGGLLLIAHEGACRERIAEGLPCRVETFGRSPDADWQVDEHGGEVTLRHREWGPLRWRNPLPGRHTSLNASAAAILACRLGAEATGVVAAIESFPGLERRMQVLGRRRCRGGDVLVVDDYGHHPTECATTLAALREHHRPRRLICVFQPHQHSRTRFLLDRFAESFGEADLVLVPDIHFVRDSEEERRRVSSGDLVARLRERGVSASHLPQFDQILRCLEATCDDGDLVVTMGAGPVDAVALAFLAGADRCR